MKDTKFNFASFEKVQSTQFDDNVLEFWGNRARAQLSCMNEIAAYID